jgi:hypothetical protein
MPDHRGRATAICSAPLEWPSRPGLPTSILSGGRAGGALDPPRTASIGGQASSPPSRAWPRRPPVGARGTRRRPRAGPRPHSPVVTPAWAQAIEGSMMLRPSRAAASSAASAGRRSGGVAPRAPGLEVFHLAGLGRGVDGQEAAVGPGRQRRGLALGVGVDADHDLLAAFDGLQAPGARSRPAALHVAGIDRGDGAAHGVDARELGARLGLQLLDLGGDHVEPSKMSPYSSRSVS